MGRKAKYLTESTKKKAKREKRTVVLQKSIYLGKVFSEWTDAKRTTEASSDRLDEIGNERCTKNPLDGDRNTGFRKLSFPCNRMAAGKFRGLTYS